PSLTVVYAPALHDALPILINKSRTVLAADPDPLVNTVTLSCNVAGFPNVLTDTASKSVNLFQPAIDVTKTAENTSKVGDTVHYVITLSNNSSGDTPALTCTATDSQIGRASCRETLPTAVAARAKKRAE